MSRVDRQRLILVAQVEIFLQIPRIHRMPGRAISAVFFQFQIPPPFLGRVHLAMAQHIVEPGQSGSGLGNVHRRPAERFFRKDPFEVPRTGLHAPPTHRAAGGGDPVGGAFLAVGFPDLVAVKHQLRTRSDRARRAFARTFITGLAKGLQAEVNRLVMRHRQVCRDDARFKARAQKRVQDHLADAADLAQTGQQQQGRLQNLAIHHRMRFGLIAKIADLACNHAPQQREPQIRAHGLRNRNPVVA